MKKILLIITCLFVLTMSTSAASRWYWVASNDTLSCYIDLTSLKYTAKNDTATCYVKFTYAGGQRYELQKTAINYSTMTISAGESYVYEAANGVAPIRIPPHGSGSILPDTFGERLAYVVRGLVGRDTKHADSQVHRTDVPDGYIPDADNYP